MIGLDTNVLVRYIVQDDVRQAKAATRLLETHCTPDEPGVISHVVLAELCWVLSRGYGYDRKTQVSVLSALLSVAELRVQDADDVWLAVRAFERGTADFADCLIGRVNADEGCDVTYTFDRRAAKSSDLHRLVT